MTMTRARLLTVSLTALALTSALAGCGSSKSSGNAAAGPGSSCMTVTGSTAKVTIEGFKFSPACISVATGTTVTFTNEDSVAHTATDSSSSGFDSKDLNKGQTYSHLFTTAGTYSYICDIHQYMQGKVVVRK
ncbi:MAG TPA: cupredoxin family copper-binding protein [Mycobacteriales bacterium]|nr:cupredoxin family copper-binding protein [Mycobacteriales bacterium]